MKFDLSQIPTTFDLAHVGLAVLALVLLCLQVVLLTVVVVSLVRRTRRVEETLEPLYAEEEVEPEGAPVEEEVEPEEIPVEKKPPTSPALAVLQAATPDSALQLLGLLQSEARFIDFVEEDISSYSDADIGAAARVVHEGCRKTLRTYFDLVPVLNELESSRVKIPAGFDASAIRLTGNIVGKAPFTGTLIHRGWRIQEVKLPKLAKGHDVNIIASAEVEL